MSEERWVDELMPDQPQWVCDLVDEELTKRSAEIERLREQLASAEKLAAAEAAVSEELETRLAEADKENQMLRANLAAADREENLILVALRLDPERYRTECGYLNVPKIVAAIKNPDMYPHAADSGDERNG